MRDFIDIVAEGEAWHGSARDFKRFSAAKIGSGQAEAKHGWGIYLTDKFDRGRFYATLETASGVIYRVQYPDGLYLDWDAPLSHQPAATAAIRAALPSVAMPGMRIMPRDQFDQFVGFGWRGSEGYKYLAQMLSNTHDLTLAQKRKASLALLAQGCLGITYLGRDAWDGVGVRGHVVFQATLLKILSRVAA